MCYLIWSLAIGIGSWNGLAHNTNEAIRQDMVESRSKKIAMT
jgi:hypothetical protein